MPFISSMLCPVFASQLIVAACLVPAASLIGKAAVHTVQFI
jgi:hypothetical protein